ncbi:glycosyltransferase [Mucilaginibacter conchicola]|uniref:Glycosyltransferase n=1 Tax=Mucilaginibacter conchicola TaxID=2303333 RepID=A0A372NZQ7_9SPHI|nr:glycosyltransferase family 4 protein [Mucilaginibacter conchicola]RFZ95606.1 glycosyltransferase [Mucilaginibacter conchicola]
MKKLAIISTHPIQYYAPVFKLLAKRNIISVKVFYTLGHQTENYDHGFNQKIAWDIPLLDGYDYEWTKNTSQSPGTHHPGGIVNPDLIKEIEEFKPDALLVFGWNYRSHLTILKYFKNKIPILFRGDSTLLNKTNPIKEILKTFYLKWVYSHVSHAFYVGKRNKAYFKKYGLRENQLSFAPHAIDNERFKVNRTPEVILLRESLQIGPDSVLIVYAGKFEPVKNLKLLVSAVASLNTPDIHLLLVGNGENEADLKLQVASAGVQSNIHFMNFVNQSYIPVIYQAADIYCLPSMSETWGLSVNEAMACRKAILASDKVGCAIDLVKNDYNGLIFKSDNELSLMNALTRLTRSKQALKIYGERSAELIESWNFKSIAEAIENHMQTK